VRSKEGGIVLVLVCLVIEGLGLGFAILGYAILFHYFRKTNSGGS
jgi:hypothetical protein